MRFPMTLLRVVTLGPALLVSFVLTVVVCALLPPALGLVAFMAAGGVLEIEFADGSKIIVNRHGVAREIWVAAKAGGFHFRRDGEAWRDTRDGAELMEKLSVLASQQAGEKIVLG